MLLASAVFDVDFLQKHDLGVELYIAEDADWSKFDIYRDLVKTIHLPYSDLNLAAFNEQERRRSINVVKDVVNRSGVFKVDTMVLHPCGVFSLNGKTLGEYDRLISSLQELADFMAQRGLILSLENQVLRRPELRVIAGCSSEEWFQLYCDVDRSNVTLTLDSSHAASASAHEADYEQRCAKLRRFLQHPEWISHFHWSDARLQSNEAQWGDMHLVPGSGDLPVDFHRAVKQHGGSILFEQACPPEALEVGLKFYESL